jgi:hypothetical protein
MGPPTEQLGNWTESHSDWSKAHSGPSFMLQLKLGMAVEKEQITQMNVTAHVSLLPHKTPQQDNEPSVLSTTRASEPSQLSLLKGAFLWHQDASLKSSPCLPLGSLSIKTFSKHSNPAVLDSVSDWGSNPCEISSLYSTKFSKRQWPHTS